MNAPDIALQGMAFELAETSWKLSLGDGVRGPSRGAVAAGDMAAVHWDVALRVWRDVLFPASY